MVKIRREKLDNGCTKFVAVEGEQIVGSLFVDPSDPQEGFGPLQVKIQPTEDAGSVQGS